MDFYIIMLSNFKQLVNPIFKKIYCWTKDHQADVVLTIGLVLIALISFGAGRLTAPQIDKEQVIIQNPTPAASIEHSLISLEGENQKEETEEGIFVGSVKSNKYHWPDCSWAKKISPENQIWFNSEEEAQAAGYIRCSSFEKYLPAGYQP